MNFSFFPLPSLSLVGLIGGLSSLILLFAYWIARRYVPLTVNSTFFLAAQKKSFKKNFSVPWTLLLELGILGLLLSIPLHCTSPLAGGRVAVVLDTSLSMAMKHEKGSTVFEAAKKRILSAVGTSDTVTLIPSPPYSEPLGENISFLTLSSALSPLNPQFKEDDLNSTLQTLRSGEYRKVIIVTDQLQPKDQSLPESFQWEQIVHPSSPTNLAIVGLSLLSSETLSLDVLNSSRESVGIKVQIAGTENERSPVFQSTARCLPQTMTSLTLPLAKALPKGAYSVKIRSEDVRIIDYLPHDDSAYFVAQPEEKKIKLVGAPLPITSLGDFTFSSREESNVALYNQRVPNLDEITTPTLVLSPPSSPLIESFACPGTKTISQWDQGHPVTRYVKFSLLSLTNTSCLAPSDSFKSIIRGELGALLVTGIKNGQPVVITTLPLFSNLSTPSLTILALNTLSWLSSKNKDTSWNSLREGFFDEWKKKSALSLTTTTTILQPGIYSSKKKPGSISAFNFFSVRESLPTLSSTLSFPDLKKPSSEIPSSNNYYSWILRTVLILIIGEYLLLFILRLRHPLRS